MTPTDDPRLERVWSRSFVGLVAGLVLIGLGGLLSLRSIHETQTNTAWVAHTIEVIKSAGNVQTMLAGIIADSRGYLLTQDADDRRQLLERHEELAGAQERVRELVADNPEQQATWQHISAVVTARAQFAEDVAHRSETNSRAAGEALLVGGRGHELSRQFADQMDDFVAAEELLLAQRQTQLRNDLWQSFALTGGTALGGMLLVALAGWLARRENRQRRIAEQNARELAELARTTLSSIGDGVITTDALGHITQLNPVAEVITGWTSEEAKDRPVSEVFHIINEHSREPVACPVTRVLQEGTIVGLANHTLLVRRDGTEVPIADSGAPIVGVNGSILGVVLVFRDQSVERDAERILRESEQQLRTALHANERIMQHSLDVICTIDEEGKFVDLSAACAQVWGYAPAELRGRRYMDLVCPEDHAKTAAAAKAITTGQPTVDFENRYQHRSGKLVPVRWSAVWSEEDRLMFCVARDITDAKKNQETLAAALATAQDANLAKSRFIANMSHELRTPLNAIIGFSEMLEGHAVGNLNTKQDRYVANVLSSGRHLLALINDILDLAKVESGKLVLLPEAFAPATAIDNALNIVRSLAERKSIKLEATCEPDLPDLYADSSKFKQVLYNLLSNAIKFTPEGGRVVLQATRIRGSGSGVDRLRIAVHDTGIGIKLEAQERVWREFEQIDSTYARAEQGTGLGLALTKQLVELHGGRIWVESTGIEGEGSTFSFELPLTQFVGGSAPEGPTPVADPQATSTPSVPAPIAGRKRPLVLVVEDDDVAHALLDNHLRNGGYEVARAHTAAEAIVMARELRPRAITLDILLPDRPGWEVLAKLNADAQTRHIPVVVVSITDDKHLGFSLGAVEFLVKPVRRDDLLDAIRRHAPPDRRGPCSVLIVDDEPATIERLVAAVRAEGHAVEIAESGPVALAQIARRRPDVLILDLMMPEMNGFEVVECLRAESATADLPILIHTSKDLTAEDRAQLGQHVQGISTKPGYERLLADLAHVYDPNLDSQSPP